MNNVYYHLLFHAYFSKFSPQSIYCLISRSQKDNLYLPHIWIQLLTSIRNLHCESFMSLEKMKTIPFSGMVLQIPCPMFTPQTTSPNDPIVKGNLTYDMINIIPTSS